MMATKPQQSFQTVPLERLEVGTILAHPVYDDRGEQEVLLVAGGVEVTSELLTKLKSRGIEQIRLSQNDLDRMGSAPASAPAPSEDVDQLPDGITPQSHFHQVKQHGASTYDPEAIQQFERNYNQSLDQVGDFFEVLSDGTATGSDAAEEVSNVNVAKLTDDLDLFVSMGVGGKDDKYPQRHSLQTMMLATSIGTTMGLQKQQLTDLGMGCLLHDVGMLMIKRASWDKRGKLSEHDRLEISKHPRLAFDRINEFRSVPNAARMIVFQMHERMNGSGYPRRRMQRQIYPLSRIAMVADVFVALVSSRPHRPGFMPYQAMEQVINQAKEGLLDSQVVRGLLKTVSLFPITSFVVMSDGRVGKVIRSNGDAFSRPIVDLWDPDATDAPPDTVDLTEALDLEVKRPLTRFEVGELGIG